MVEHIGDFPSEEFVFDSSLNRIFEPENFRFLFATKNSLTWEVKCENQASENRREFIRKAQKLYLNGTVIINF